MILSNTIIYILKTLVIVTIISSISGCGGSSADGVTQTNNTNCTTNTLPNYDVSWNAVNDSDLTGYRVYYGTTSPLDKTNSNSVDLGNTTNWSLNTADLGLLPCDRVYIAVTSVGSSKVESQMSTVLTQDIN